MDADPVVRPRLVQLASSLGFVVVLLDVSVVNVALGALQSDLQAGLGGLQWVINAYTLAFAALLLTAGALGDRIGPRRSFAQGFALFIIASLACGLATSLPVLIAARLVQGVGAALLVPNSLSLLNQVFRDPAARSRAVGWWGAGGAIALAAGPLVGGLLIDSIGWRSIFLINVPVGICGLWLAWRHAPTALPQQRRGIDIPGQVTAALALSCLTIALTETSTRGWGDPMILGLIAVAILIAALFVWLERGNPSAMVPLDLFRRRALSSAVLIGLAANLAFYGNIFLLSLYFQEIRHLSPEDTGLAFLPMTAMLVIANLIASRIAPRVGPHRLTAVGMAVSAAGYCLLAGTTAATPYGDLVAPMLLAGGGIALVIPTITTATLAAVPADRAGIASGLVNSARQVGGMIGIALFGYLVRNPDPAPFLQGMHQASYATSGLLIFGAVLGLFGIAGHDRQRKRTGSAAGARGARPGTQAACRR